MNRSKHIPSLVAASLATVALLPSCSMMREDIDDCPQGLYVRFVYDYNTQRADMFKDQVGHVTLYIYNENGELQATRTVSNTAVLAPLSTYGYSIHLDPSELPPGRYRLQAVAMQRDWEEALATPGAKYRRNTPSSHEDLTVALDRSESLIDGTQRYAVSADAPLDTLWHTLKVSPLLPQDGLDVPEMPRTSRPYSVYPLHDQMAEVRADRATYATVSLIRDTKHLNITLRELDDPTEVYADKFEVRVLDNNRTVAHDNEVVTADSLHYSPYATWTSRFLADGSVEVETVHEPATLVSARDRDAETEKEVVQRTAHYNLMFNRMMHNAADNADNAILEIVNKENGAVVAHINLPSMLAEGRSAYELYNYSPQEYLDREHDYHLDFFLRGDKWLYCDIVINVLSWSKRTQNVEL